MFDKIDVVQTVKDIADAVLYNNANITTEVNKLKREHDLTGGEVAMLTRMAQSRTADSLF